MLAFAMTIGNMFSPIGTYNMRIFQISDTQNKYSQPEYVGFRIQTLILGCILLVPYTLVVGIDLDTTLVVLIFLLFKIDESFCDVFYGIDQRNERMDIIGISQITRGALLLSGFCLSLAFFNSLKSACASMFLLCFLVTLFFDVRQASRFGHVFPRINFRVTLQILFECAPLVIGALCMSSVVAVARQYYGGTFGVENLGIYAAVATPAVIVQALARFLYSPVLTPLANRLAKSTPSFLALLRRVLLSIFLVSIVAVLLLSLIGPPLLVIIYGDSIADYTYLFTYVLISTVFIVLAELLSDILTILRRLWSYALSMILALALGTVIMIPFEGLWGMNGINFVVIAAMGASILFSAVVILRSIRNPQ